VVPLVEEVAASVKEQFRPYVPRLLPLILQVQHICTHASYTVPCSIAPL
jgi:hypothetical protein